MIAEQESGEGRQKRSARLIGLVASPATLEKEYAALDSGARPLLKSQIIGQSTSVNRPNINSSSLEFPEAIERPLFGPPEQP